MDAHVMSVAGLYILQLTIMYKLGKLEARLRGVETNTKPREYAL